MVEPRAAQGDDEYCREKKSLCSQFLELKSQRQKKIDIEQEVLRKETGRLMNRGPESEQLTDCPYLFLKDWDGA